MIIKCDPGSHRIKSGRIDVLVKDTILRFRKRDTQLNQLRIIYLKKKKRAKIDSTIYNNDRHSASE